MEESKEKLTVSLLLSVLMTQSMYGFTVLFTEFSTTSREKLCDVRVLLQNSFSSLSQISLNVTGGSVAFGLETTNSLIAGLQNS